MIQKNLRAFVFLVSKASSPDGDVLSRYSAGADEEIVMCAATREDAEVELRVVGIFAGGVAIRYVKEIGKRGVRDRKKAVQRDGCDLGALTSPA